MNLNLAAYIRMSFDVQKDSPETQRQLIENYCRKHGHSLVAVYVEEGVSASIPISDRPVAADMLRVACRKDRPWDGIVFVRMDRMFRNLEDQLIVMRVLEKHRCALHTTEGPVDRSTPEAGFMLAVLGAAAELERKLTAKRFKDKNASRALRGVLPCGLPPLGLTYDKESQRCVRNDRADDALFAFESYVQTGGNANRTCRDLNNSGILTRLGNQWESSSLRATLSSAFYRCKMPYDGVHTPTENIDRIIPEALTAAVDDLLARSREMPARTKGADLAYGGIMYCSECGRRLVSHSGNARSRGGRIGWICNGRAVGICRTRRVSERFIDPLVARALKRVLLSLSNEIIGAKPRRRATPTANVEKVRTRLNDQRRRWTMLFAEGRIDYEEMDRRIRTIDADLSRLLVAPITVTIDPEDRRAWIAKLDNGVWSTLPSPEKRELLRILGARMTVGAVKSERLWIELETKLTSTSFREENQTVRAPGRQRSCVYEER